MIQAQAFQIMISLIFNGCHSLLINLATKYIINDIENIVD